MHALGLRINIFLSWMSIRAINLYRKQPNQADSEHMLYRAQRDPAGCSRLANIHQAQTVHMQEPNYHGEQLRETYTPSSFRSKEL